MNNLRKIREKRGLTQFELAKMADIYPTTISEIERDKRVPYPGWITRLAKALEVPEEELFPEEMEKAQGER